MKRNRKLKRLAENDLSKYNNDEFLSFLKNQAGENRKNHRKKSTLSRTLWAVSITTVVVMSLIVVLATTSILNAFNQKNNSDTMPNGSLSKVNSFVRSVKFQNINDDEIYIYKDVDVDKPYFNVTNEDVKIDVYRGDATLISENIYSEKTTMSGYELNCFEQTFAENNDEHISISGFINTGTEILYFMYVKPLGNADKDEFMKSENSNLIKILNNLIVLKK